MATHTGKEYATQTPFGCATPRVVGAVNLVSLSCYTLRSIACNDLPPGWLSVFQVRSSAVWPSFSGGPEPVPEFGQLWPLAG